ncbi:putative protease Do-like 14 isoform X2 [Impatiens glandulifera]|uniref:putative protease Do-like 14 isoform X2 n=1 Tax=Impatiens glandulifera TaxID=253017 RepID=UPI001FB0F202|nr:putative protease Do-like 14 isoform X2 [Impatiens glandulifera]XP_047314299.1 putative protease Do-like 14 isoform X2 [Impatiens glandulifera]
MRQVKLVGKMLNSEVTILKRFPTSNKSSLLRSLVLSASIAAAKSGLYFYSNIDTDPTRPSLWISVNIPKHDHPSWWPWRTWGPMFLQPSFNCLGNVPLFFSRSGGDIPPPADTSKEAKDLHRVTLGKSVGSGTIMDSDSTILTCAHLVVSHHGLSTKVGKVDVTLQDGRTFEG